MSKGIHIVYDEDTYFCKMSGETDEGHQIRMQRLDKLLESSASPESYRKLSRLLEDAQEFLPV